MFYLDQMIFYSMAKLYLAKVERTATDNIVPFISLHCNTTNLTTINACSFTVHVYLTLVLRNLGTNFFIRVCNASKNVKGLHIETIQLLFKANELIGFYMETFITF